MNRGHYMWRWAMYIGASGQVNPVRSYLGYDIVRASKYTPILKCSRKQRDPVCVQKHMGTGSQHLAYEYAVDAHGERFLREQEKLHELKSNRSLRQMGIETLLENRYPEWGRESTYVMATEKDWSMEGLSYENLNNNFGDWGSRKRKLDSSPNRQ